MHPRKIIFIKTTKLNLIFKKGIKKVQVNTRPAFLRGLHEALGVCLVYDALELSITTT